MIHVQFWDDLDGLEMFLGSFMELMFDLVDCDTKNCVYLKPVSWLIVWISTGYFSTF